MGLAIGSWLSKKVEVGGGGMSSGDVGMREKSFAVDGVMG